MILLSGHSRRSLLIVVLAQIWLGFGAVLNLRQNAGDSDSDSDDDETSESCSNGVCTTVTKTRGGPGSATQTGVNTQGNNPSTQGSNSNQGGNSNQGNNSNQGSNHTKTQKGTSATSGISTTLRSPAPTGGSTANDNNPPNPNNAAHKGGLRTGGIVGLVIGLLILLGLIAMFIIKRRNHLREVRKQPRGATLLSSKPGSLLPDYPGGEMTQVPFSPSVLSPGAVAAAHVRTAHEQPKENYGPLNVRADGTSTSHTPLLDAAARQAPPLADNHTNTADASPFMESLPSPYEMTPRTSWNDAAAVAAVSSSSSSSSAAQKPLPNAPPQSAIHSEMAAYQKALERDDEKSNQPSGSRTDIVDPPPVYSD